MPTTLVQTGLEYEISYPNTWTKTEPHASDSTATPLFEVLASYTRQDEVGSLTLSKNKYFTADDKFSDYFSADSKKFPGFSSKDIKIGPDTGHFEIFQVDSTFSGIVQEYSCYVDHGGLSQDNPGVTYVFSGTISYNTPNTDKLRADIETIIANTTFK